MHILERKIDMNKLIKRILSVITSAAIAITSYAAVIPVFTVIGSAVEDPKIIVSLGDSYSSGEGVEPFYGQTGTDEEKVADPDWVAHRSTKAWGGRLTLDGVTGTMSDHKGTNWIFAAASGAETTHFSNGQTVSYDFNEQKGSKTLPPQLDAFNGIGESVDYVTITIGGNDIGFVTIMKATIIASDEDFSKTLEQKWNDFDDHIADDIAAVYSAVAEKAPNAAIIVAGYPTLIPANGFTLTMNIFGQEIPLQVSAERTAAVNNAVKKFNGKIKAIVDNCRANGMNIRFVSVEDAFAGHEAYTDKPYINPIITDSTIDTQDLNKPVTALTPSAYSIHPNELGSAAYAAAVQAEINKLEHPFTVTFDSKGGTAVDSQKVVSGEKADEPTAPTREGNTFAGWYDNENCTGDPFDFTNSVITADMTLYAKWTHIHNFTYSVDGTTITATCSSDGCTLDEHKAVLTIAAPTLTIYGGAGSEAATLTGLDAFNSATGLAIDATDIKYYEAEELIPGYKKAGDELAHAPTGVGDYFVGLTLINVKISETETKDVSVYVPYTIAKADPAYTVPTGLTATFGQTLEDVKLPDGWAWADSTQSVGNVVSPPATFKAIFTPDDTTNYNTVENDVPVTVIKVDPTVTAPTANELTYNGSAQALVTAGEANAGTMVYSLTENGTYTEDIPTGTNAGDYTVFYKVIGDANHSDSAADSINITIARKAVVVAADDKTRAVAAPDPELTATVTGLVGSDTISYTLSREAGEDVGTYTITPSGDAEQGNYTVTYQTGIFTIADIYVDGEPVEGTFTDILKNAKGDKVVITLGKDVSISKLTFPKEKDAKEIIIDGNGYTIGFTGSASIKPNQKLTLVNVNIEAVKNGKPQTITITSSKYGLTLENVELNGKKATVTASSGDLTLDSVSGNEITIRGATKTTLTVNNSVTAATVTGFGTIAENGTLTVTKSLTVNELGFADNAVLKIAADAAATIKKGISGNGTISLASGFKPISISGALNGTIKLTGDKMTDGTQLFKTKLDLTGKVDISGIIPEVTDGEYEYGMYMKSGKVYLRAFKLQFGGKTYCEYSDIISEITKAGKSSESYTINLLGSIDLGSAFKFPTKGKYAGLTINGNGHTITFKNSSIALTADLTLKDITLNATAKNGCTIKLNKFSFDTGNAKLVNCMIK